MGHAGYDRKSRGGEARLGPAARRELLAELRRTGDPATAARAAGTTQAAALAARKADAALAAAWSAAVEGFLADRVAEHAALPPRERLGLVARTRTVRDGSDLAISAGLEVRRLKLGRRTRALLDEVLRDLELGGGGG